MMVSPTVRLSCFLLPLVKEMVSLHVDAIPMLTRMWHNYFDKIFLINLPQRKDRYWQSSQELGRYRIPYELFSATKKKDGREGLYITMRALFQKALRDGLKSILVFEDDALFKMDPEQVMEKCLQQLPKDFDLLYLGCNLAQQPSCFVGANLVRITGALSTHAVAYSRGCMEKILAFPMILPFDLLLLHNVQAHGRSYCTCPMLVTQRVDHSDIENRLTDWSAVLDQRFESKISILMKTMPEDSRQCCRA
jgi:GR25 family glycosyltransferase involved in LPS biosynthesis